MINLLPPDIKEEITYSKYNAIVVRYLVIVLGVAALLAGALIGAQFYLGQKTSASTNRLIDTQSKMSQYSSVQKQAKELNARITSIQTIQNSQTRFSELLSNLAAATPQGVALTGIALTNDKTKPVRVQAQAVDYRSALAFRDSIVNSPAFTAADAESITQGDPYSISLTFTFNPKATK